MTELANRVRSLVRDVPDFPKKGIVFKDITPVLRDGIVFDRVCAAMASYAAKRGADVVAAVESRGFIFGAAVATRLDLGFVPIRKIGKLPWKTVKQRYDLEYGTDAVEIHRDAVRKGQRVIVVDDVLATGGTLVGACKLVQKVGGVVAGCAVLVELGFLKGRKKLRGRDLFTVIAY